MHQPMRRTRQQLSDEETAGMLDAATSGVLALVGPDGYPYAVPLSFVHERGSIFFHSAAAGHKLDAIGHSEKASFCVIAEDDVVPSKLTTRYRSAIVFGVIRVLGDDERRLHALRLIAAKYSPDHLADAEADITRDWNRVCVLELAIEEMTGKAGLEIIRERELLAGQGREG